MPQRTRTNRLFPTGTKIGALFEKFPMTAGSLASETAEQSFKLPDPAHPGQDFNYAFLFWNIAGNVSTNPIESYTVPTTDYVATAWYVQVGGGDGTGLTTWAFSSQHDIVESDTPIQSVTPAGAWAGLNATFISTTVGLGPVVVTAHASIPSAPGENFYNWFPLSGVGTPAGNQLTVPNGSSAWALAVYAVPEGVRLPNIVLVDELQAILGRILVNVGDPAPRDLSRITQELTKNVAAGPDDELSKVLANIDKASKADIRAALVEVQTRARRLDAAQKLLDTALKEGT
jgi:hypothetical protein